MIPMKDTYLEIKDYINRMLIDEYQEHFEYEHFPFMQNILNNFTVEEENNLVEDIFTWTNHQKYVIAYFLETTNYKLKGKYNSAYVFCECFSAIEGVEYLAHLSQNLEIQLMFCKNKEDLSIEKIVNNLYVVINHTKDTDWIEHYLKIIDEISDFTIL